MKIKSLDDEACGLNLNPYSIKASLESWEVVMSNLSSAFQLIDNIKITR